MRSQKNQVTIRSAIYTNLVMPMSFFRRNCAQPQRVSTDQIFPVHYWDDIPAWRAIVLYCLFRFDDALDADKLNAALTAVLQQKEWNKLGARLRRNRQGSLEYHVPEHFDCGRPPFAYHHEAHGESITEHPLASLLPKASTRPQIVGRGDDFLPLMRRPDDPRSLDDYLQTDRPVLGLHIVTFTDATLVTLSWSHVLLDGLGRKALFDAWSLALQGRFDEMLPLQGVATDPLQSLGTQSTEEYLHADKKLRPWQSCVFILRCLFDRIFRRPKEESRIICVPAAYVKSLHSKCTTDLAKTTNVPMTKTTFLSEGDVLCAFFTWVLVKSTCRISNQVVAIYNAFGLRRLLSDSLLTSGAAYVANAVTTVPTFLTAAEISRSSISHIAAALRKAITQLGARGQVEARLFLDRQAIDKGGNPILFGSHWMDLIICTNWSKGQFYNVDFSAAVSRDGQHYGQQKSGRPSYIQIHAFAGPPSPVRTFAITGKDAAGNYWLQSVLRKQYWPMIEQCLATV